MSDRTFSALWIIFMVLLLCAYFEIDSRFQQSYIRDLQRRVGQLESERR